MIIWKRQTGQYQNGISGYVGDVKVFSIYPDSTVPRGSALQYRIACLLPGICNKELPHAINANIQKEKAEEILSIWMDKAGLCYKSRNS